MDKVAKMNSQVLIDRELLQKLIDGSGMSEYCTDSVVDEATRLLAAPAPIPDAVELERLVTEQVKHAYYERKTITEAVGEIVSALQADHIEHVRAMVVPDVRELLEYMRPFQVVAIQRKIDAMLAASPAPGDSK